MSKSPDQRTLVALCIPAQDEVKTEFALSLAALVRMCGGYRLVITRGSSSIVTNARNFCMDQIETTEEVLEEKIDWLFWLDSDIQFPANALARLLGSGKEIIGAAYPRRTPPFDVMAKFLPGKPVTANSGVHEVAALPTGCLLVRRSVFFKMKKPFFRIRYDESNGVTTGEDIVFCETVRSLGYRTYVDLDLTREIGHVGSQIYLADVHEEPPLPAMLKLPSAQETAMFGERRGRG